jgi:hypothetical protein
MLEGLAASYQSDLFLFKGSGQVSLERICAQELRFRDDNRSRRKMEEDGGMLEDREKAEKESGTQDSCAMCYRWVRSANAADAND